MAPTAAAFAALLSLALYVLISLLGRREGATIGAWFRHAGRPWTAIVSLTACNVTLGTGISYTISQASNTGWLVLLTPFGITVGYFSIAAYFRRLGFSTSEERPDLYFLLAERQSDGSLRPGLFQSLFTGLIVLTYFLLLAFELGVGSSFVGASMLAAPSDGLTIGISILIFGIVLVYTSISGVRAAVNTDVAQIGFIVAFVVVVAVILLRGADGSIAATQAPITRASLLGAALAVITAISTQFYNIVNPQIAAPHPPETQSNIYRWAGIWSGLIYLLVAFIGLLAPEKGALESSLREFLYAPTDSVWAIVVAVVIFAGMLAVLLSTLDNLAIALAQLVYDMTCGGRSAQPRVLKLQVVYVVVGLTAIPLAAYLYLKFKSYFYLLLTILFAITTLSPFVFTAMFLRAKKRTSLIESKGVTYSVLALTITAWLFYMKLNYDQDYHVGTLLHLGAFFAASALAVVDVVRSRPTGH